MTLLFDQAALERHRNRVKNTFCPFLFEKVAGQMAQRIQQIRRNFSTWIDYSSPHTGGLFPYFHDFLPKPQPFLKQETTFPVQAIFSALAGHWVNHFPEYLQEIRGRLCPDGLAVISFFGGDTLRELRYAFFQAELELKGGAWARVSPFITVQQAAALLQHAGFALPVVDQDCLTVIYPDLVSLMRQLRAMGETNALVERTKYFTPRSIFEKTEEIYKKFYGTECGGVRATFQLITLTGWAPDACQQKPLKPGSAQKKLQDVL